MSLNGLKNKQEKTRFPVYDIKKGLDTPFNFLRTEGSMHPFLIYSTVFSYLLFFIKKACTHFLSMHGLPSYLRRYMRCLHSASYAWQKNWPGLSAEKRIPFWHKCTGCYIAAGRIRRKESCVGNPFYLEQCHSWCQQPAALTCLQISLPLYCDIQNRGLQGHILSNNNWIAFLILFSAL